MERFQQRFLSKRWQKVLLVLSGIVVFVTTYALILPAITIDTDTAEREPGIVIETSEEAEFPAVNLENEAAAITVKVDADVGVFPVDTVLVVNEAEETPEMRSAIQDAVSAKVTDVCAVDVAFETPEGEAVSPQDIYQLTLNSELITADEDQAVVAITGSGDVQVLNDPAVSYQQAVLEADGELTVAVVRTEELTAEYLSDNGELYEVTVTYDYTANIPEGSRLVITEFDPASPEYEAIREAVLLSSDFEASAPAIVQSEEGIILRDGADVSADDPEIEIGLDAFDLTIFGPDGAPVEPAAPVQVSIQRKALPDEDTSAEDYDQIKVMHLNESGDAPFVENMQPMVLITEDGITATFETESFSTYTLNWTYRSSNRTYYRSSTIHYGYMNGNRFVELNVPQSINIATDNGYAFLIYDIPGYHFKGAHLNSGTGTAIEPLIRYNNSRWQYTPDGNTSWSNIAYSNNTTANQDIYMVYEADSAVAQGGEAKLYEYGADDTPALPTAEKNSVNNHDGTRTISLSISGGATPIEVEKLADVIVVFDRSGSMGRYVDSDGTAPTDDSRLYHTKEAAKALADELLNGEQYFNRDGDHLVRMALVQFSNDAEVVNSGFEQGNFTENYTKFAAAIDGMSANGGTNWEHALQLANQINDLDPERATFVIFITDGNPTFRMTRSPQDAMTDTELVRTGNSVRDMYTTDNSPYSYYRDYSVFGQGSSDNLGNNYAAALDQVESIISHNKRFYSIGISNNVTNLENLTEEGHTNVGKDGTDHCFNVSDKDELYNAFNEIRAAIAATLGWTNVSIDDGITEETELSAKVPVAGILEADNFKYYITKNGVTTPWTLPNNCNPAAYNPLTGNVEWHMGNNFQLEAGVTYTVEFMVWPSQDALDYITQIMNGATTYDELPADVKEQIVQDPVTGVYTLKTNREPMTFSYQLSKKQGDTVTVDQTLSGTGNINVLNSDPLVLETMLMTIDKEWLDNLNNAEDRMDEVTLYLQRRLYDPANGPDDNWDDFEVFHRNADGTWETSSRFLFNETNEWSISFYITPGLVDSSSDPLDPGYEYRVLEPVIDYHYLLDGEVVRPMFYGNEDNDSAVQMAADEDGKVNDNLTQKDVYIVENYLGDSDGSHSLSAVNKLKGSLDVKKIFLDTGTNPPDDDVEFTIKGYLLDPNGNPFLFDTSLDTRTDKSKGDAAHGATPEWIAHSNDTGAFHVYNAQGQRIGYKMHVASTGDITLHLKAGEYVRFVNIPKDCTYAFWEPGDELPQGYQWVSTEGYNQYRESGEGELLPYPPHPYPEASGVNNDGDYWLGGTIYEDAHHTIEVSNKYVEPNSIVATKTVYKTDGTTQIWPQETFTVTGYITNRYGLGYTFDPALDDRTDKSQPLAESEYSTHTWDDHQDDPIAYNIIDKDGNYVVYKGHFPTTDTFTVELRGGDSLVFLNVPPLCSYMIWEDTSGLSDPNSLYEYVNTTVDSSSENGTVQSPPRVQQSFGEYCGAGTIHEGEEHDVHFFNKLKRDPIPIQLVKTDADNNALKINGAVFMLYADADHTTPATDFEGNEIGEIVTAGFADADQTEPLGIGTIGSLWPGTYYLVETGAPPGYETLSGHVVINIGSNGAVTVTNPDFAAATGSGFVTEQNGLITVAIPNTPRGTVLPSTGGRGTAIYISCGLLLMLTAVLIYIFSLRRRKGVRVNS